MYTTPTPIQPIVTAATDTQGIRLMIKRDDLIHPYIMGNKWRKLKYNLLQARELGKKTLLTFGGAYSNHIAATAAAAKEQGFESVGIISGDELSSESNTTLRTAHQNGMDLRFVSRASFRQLKADPSLLEVSQADTYILPEGGTNSHAIKGAAEIVSEIDESFDFVVCPIGTGGTLAGVLSALPEKAQAIGVSALKGDFVHRMFRQLLADHELTKENYRIMDDYHFGGYARYDDRLIDFINDFKGRFDLALDPVYTGKMVFAVFDLIEKKYFPKNTRIILIHTGGIQGIEGFNEKHGKKIC